MSDPRVTSCPVCGAEVSHLNQGLCKNFHYQNIPEKDDVHWITGQEFREIYADTDKLSLDKYDETRKRSVPAYEAMLAESLTEDQARTLLMWLARNRKELFSQIVCPACKEDVAEKAAAEARKDEREKVLDELEQTLTSDKCPVDKCEGGNCVPCIIKSLRSEVKKP